MVSSLNTARREDGQATVEFAIVIPLLLLLIIGILEFGKAFNSWIDLNHLSNEGARWAAVNKVPPYGTNPGQSNPTCDQIKRYLLSQMNTGDLQAKVEGNPPDPMLKNIKLSVPNPTGPNNTPQIGDAVEVNIQAPKYSIASLSGFLGNLPTITLGAKSTMRLEQLPSWLPAGQTEC